MGDSYLGTQEYELVSQSNNEQVYERSISLQTSENESTDTFAYQQGYITVTPLKFDWTAYESIQTIRDWNLKLGDWTDFDLTGIYCNSRCPLDNGGGGEIRTLGGLSPSLVFKTSALNHSATPPEGPNLTQKLTWLKQDTHAENRFICLLKTLILLIYGVLSRHRDRTLM